MEVSLFDYNLPKELIAQHPHIPRDECKLLVCNRQNHTIEHRIFKEIINYIDENDLLVLNDTKVIPARIFAQKPTGGKIEIFLLEEIGKGRFLCLTRGKLKKDTIVYLKNSKTARITRIENSDKRIVEFETNENIYELLEDIGEVPLPPYIQRNYDNYNKEKDFKYYQTVFAKKEGAVASPTAGLHFTEKLINSIKAKGVKIAYITLHVGIGTFRPVKEKEVEKHKMHSEKYQISKETADLFNQTKSKRRRVIAVGTTVVRALESSINKDGILKPQKSSTDIFIYPGYKYKAVDALITNFHLPKSTLLMLVSAFYEREKILNCYKEAIDKHYRFFSFGDAMFIY
ncbi:tRNA preQ1(34) S-adenosylmethionine ribosyltransferase-isomerase QueA [Hippea maritima]|uniref:S-adenosylmethionine:tRNA ribosyltransferase-isomerase n=1 Tax=Hippea maritima (strain ATCC 700847 / DSM 10411 / MH2) TaxID=760142 RepID=F2LXW0_HIPMA|nr:tRNA preQ1(34) S-adenosylmethionine ribosyltransferase-isomerase QueA [Hippea maritima]AEA34351.1 S-adenosylmethionine:tRNA ribosyltransferase-isomerase [Hippea maritima DSM 10411]